MEYYKKLIAFDLDGTLNQTHVYALDAYKKMINELKLGTHSDQDIINRFGATEIEDIHYFLGVEATENQKAKYRDSLKRHWIESQKMNCITYPKVKETLLQLRDLGYVLCICSNAPIEEIESTLKLLKIYDCFDGIQGITDKKSKVDSLRCLVEKYKPESTYMVGDRFYDYQAALANNAIFIGCCYGYGKSEEFKTAKYTIQSFEELIETMKVIC